MNETELKCGSLGKKWNVRFNRNNDKSQASKILKDFSLDCVLCLGNSSDAERP